MSSHTLTITEELENIRIDRLLVKQFTDLSRTYIQHLIETGNVLLNGKSVKKRETAKNGDTLSLTLEEKPESLSIVAENIPLDVIYEDEYFIAVNKPTGLVTHPGAGQPKGTFVNALKHYLGTLPHSDDPLRPGIIHRLDKETSGIILGAKTTLSHQKFSDLFKNREIQKSYLTICHGCPKKLKITDPIGRHPVNRKKMAVKENGKPAETTLEILSVAEKYSLLHVYPKTGRTHQIRVHLLEQGTPIAGDPIYSPSKNLPRLFLHAYTLHFTHPFTNQPITLKAPIPTSFHHFSNSLFSSALPL